MPADGNSPELVDAPRMFPGVCVDGSQGKPGEAVIDTGWEFGDGMHVYLSRTQVLMYGRLVGMVERTEALALEDRAAVAELKVRELETDLADAQPILAAIQKASARYGDDA